jgi:hypothetical protein
MYTPYVNVWISLIGLPSNEDVFSDVEFHVRGFPNSYWLLAPFAIVRYLLFPFNPPKDLLAQHTDSSAWYKP